MTCHTNKKFLEKRLNQQRNALALYGVDKQSDTYNSKVLQCVNTLRDAIRQMDELSDLDCSVNGAKKYQTIRMDILANCCTATKNTWLHLNLMLPEHLRVPAYVGIYLPIN